MVGVRTAALPGSVVIFIMTLTRTTHMLVFSSHFHLARDACQFVQSFHFLSSMRCGCHICCCHPMMFRSRISHQTQNDLWGGRWCGAVHIIRSKAEHWWLVDGDTKPSSMSPSQRNKKKNRKWKISKRIQFGGRLKCSTALEDVRRAKRERQATATMRQRRRHGAQRHFHSNTFLQRKR